MQSMTTTTATSNLSGVLVRVIPQEDGSFIVADMTGYRYGHNHNLAEAALHWAQDVSELLREDDETIAGPLLAEVRAYRKALASAPLPPQ